MPIVLSVNNELKLKKRIAPVELLQSPEPAKDCKGNKCMTQAPVFCQYPDDLDSCRQLLIQAWRTNSLDGHCIIKGLQKNWQHCRQILKEGLYNEDKRSENIDISEACKQVVLLGYPLDITAIHEVFSKAYYKLVWYVIERFDIKDNSSPSADDVFQDVFVALHKHFRKGVSVNRRLTSYIWQVAANECRGAIRSEHKHAHRTNEKQPEQEETSFCDCLPKDVVECWEDLDNKLLKSDQNNLINRIILAQWAQEGSSTAKKSSARQFKEDWRYLSQMSQADVADLHGRILAEANQYPSKGVIPLAANIINKGNVKQYQTAIVLAAAMGMGLEQTGKLIEQMNSLSKNAVYARICRIVTALKRLRSEN